MHPKSCSDDNEDPLIYYIANTVGYCPLNRQEQTPVKFQSEFYDFHVRKCIRKCPFCPGGDEFTRTVRGCALTLG